MAAHVSDYLRPARLALLAALIVALIVTALVLIERLERYDLRASPLAYDWEILWDATEGGHVRWDAGMFSPPWAVIFVLPLSWLSLNTSWAIMTLLSLAALVLSVPRYAHWQHHLLGVALLFTSYSYRRYFVDINYEAISILAILALLLAYQRRWPVVFAVAGMISTIKPQITFLLVLAVGVYVLQVMPRAFTLQVITVVGAVVVLSVLWAGKPWLDTLTTRPFDYGISLAVTGEQIGVPEAWLRAAQALIIAVTLAVAYAGNRELSRPKAGMLIAGSLLSAPFSNLHSMLPLLAIGVVPLALERPKVGLWLVLLFNVNYLDVFGLTNWFDMYTGYGRELWTGVLVATWITLTAYVAITEGRANLRHRLPVQQKAPQQVQRKEHRSI